MFYLIRIVSEENIFHIEHSNCIHDTMQGYLSWFIAVVRLNCKFKLQYHGFVH